MSPSESISGTGRLARAPAAGMRRHLKRPTARCSPQSSRLRWQRAILLAIVMIHAGNHLVGALQHDVAISVDKLDQRQQIFHQLKPSQQLAGSSQRHDSGNPSADLIGINDNNNNKSRHTNSTPPHTQQQLPLSLRVVPISSRGALSFVMSSGIANPSAKCSTATAASTASPRRPFALGQQQQQPTSVSGEVLAVEGTNLKLNLAIVGFGADQKHQLAPISLRLHWQRDGQPIGDLNQARGRMASIQLVGESEPETIRHLLGLNGSSHGELERAQSGWMTSVGEEQQRAPTSFVLFPFVNERLLEELDRSHLTSGPSRGGHPAQSLRQRLAKAHDQQQQQQLRQLREDKFLADGQSIDWPKLGLHLVGSLNQQHCQLDQQSQLEQLLIIQLELNQLRLQDRGQYQLLVCQQQQQQQQVSGAHEPTGAVQPGGQPADCLQSQLVSSFNLQLIEDVPRLESWFEPQLLEPGDRLSIKCEATGFTLPQISWFLDGQLLSEQPAPQQQQANSGPDGQQRSSFGLMTSQLAHSSSSLLHVQLTSGQSETARHQEGGSSFRIGDYVSSDNHVHSFVNSSYGVRLGDGGFYKCQANNGLHLVEHEARIDVRGPVAIGRLLPYNVSSLAGSGRLELQCPWSGYPAGPIEWYFKPQVVAGAGPIGRAHSDPSPDYSQLDSSPSDARRRAALVQSRLKRHGRELAFASDEYEAEWAGGEAEGMALADEQADLPDPERDEWLAQASAMTGPPTPDEYPEPLPDYPIPVFDDSLGSNSLEPSGETDYEKFPLRRTRRATATFDSDEATSQRGAPANRWLKLPQSRRHQVHPNGTLTLRDVQPDDQGLYKCRVTRAAGHQQQQQQHQTDQANNSHNWSNELHLAVLVAPVISPFGSSESLREGMRNFLTCSVIGGDSPVRLAWLKDGRPIEEHIGGFGSMATPVGELNPKQAPISENPSRRIKLDSSNEFTSTLSFGHVDFRDNGNYTCLASNKAASVNYTARMVVNVPPKWIKIPKDVESVAGQSILIDCQAEAHPNPRVWWEIGVTSSSQLAAAGQHHAEHAAKTIDFRPGQSDPHQSHQSASGALEQAPNHYRTIISNSRIHILENASLVIRDLTKQDQGFYLCQAANNFGLLSSLIKLTVNVGASFANKFQMKFVRLNERVELDCDPAGQTPLTVTWFVRHHNNQNQNNNNNNNNNNNDIREPNGILAGQTPIGNQLNESYASPILAGFEHLGRAIVSNNQSSSASSYARRHRQQHHSGKPAEMATNSMDDDDGGGGHSSKLDAIGRRRLFTGTIQTRELGAGQANEAKLIEIDSSISFETLKLRPPTEATGGDKQQPEAIELVRLHIKQARRANSGDYICHAANEFGDDEKLIKLLVQEPPDPVRDVSLLLVDSRQVSLTWPAPFNGNSLISSYTLEWATLNTGEASGEHNQQQTGRWSQLTIAQSQQHDPQQQPQLVATLSQLQPLTSYEIRVRAQNQFGLSPVAPSLVVTTSEEAPVAPPGDIRAIALSSSRIQVSWLPPPVAVAPSDGKQQQTSTANNKNTALVNSIKGYYLGYKTANSNESFIFKTIAVPQAAEGLAPSAPGKQHRLEFGNSLEAGANSAARLVRAVIGDLKRSTAYSIILQAYNSAGPGPQSDPLQVRTLDNDPPPAPVLRVVQATSSSLELQWSFRPSQLQDSADSSVSPVAKQQHQQQQVVATVSDRSKQSTSPPALIEGYHLYFRSVGGVQSSESFAQGNSAGSDQWQERRLSQEIHVIAPAQQQVADPDDQNKGQQDLTIVELHRVTPSMNFANWSRFHGSNTTLTQRNFRYQLDGLTCGNFYQIYLVAYNNYGSGQPSQLVRAKTRGLVPVAPRNQADFVLANSTQVQLNLAAWQNGGCPLTNFEIKYKQLRNRLDAIAMLQSVASSSKRDQNGSPGRNSDWLLLSNNISPEQRSIELRDVQPETWYGLWVISESAAGKTSAHFAFMTLDRLGRLPNEAVEPLPVLSPDQNSDPNSMTSINNLSALFQSGTSSNPIRSILVSLSGGDGRQGGNPNGLVGSPLILSTCLCLILFATCLLVLIRRYNNLAKDDQSVDLRLARSGASSHPGSKSFQGARTSEAAHHLEGEQYGVKSHHYAMATSGGPPLSDETRSISPQDTHYSLRVSPCKTGATVITNSSSSTNGSSSGALLLPGPTAAAQCESAHLAYGTMANHNHHHHHHLQQELSNGELNHTGAIQQHVPMEQLSQFVACSAATLNPQHRNSRLFGKDYNKFSTLDQHHHLSQAQPLIQDEPIGGGMPSTCFRTLPHQNLRPVSTFLPHGNVQHLNNCQLEQSQNSSQDYNNYQQQIYSKLRLLQHLEEAPTNGNCNAMCQLQQQQQASNEVAAVALDQLLGQAGSSLVGDLQIQANQNGCPNSATCQQQNATSNNGGPSEQDDYALPFPPKWV